MIPMVKTIMKFLEADGIPYKVVYPSRDCKEEYKDRYIERGNSPEFLEVFIDGWDIMLDGLDSLGGTAIELSEGQFLSDVIQPFNCEENQYIERQILSFKHSLEWENPRYKDLKEKIEDEELQSAKRYYMNQSFINGGGRCQHTFVELKELFEGNEDLKCFDENHELTIEQFDQIFGLIEKVINEVNLNYFEYDSTGEHLRFTQKISMTDLNLERKLTRCLDKNNYLDVRYNQQLQKMNYEDIKNLSLLDIEKKYLKEYMDIIFGILRKGNCYWDEVISKEVSDEFLKQMICEVYKQSFLQHMSIEKENSQTMNLPVFSIRKAYVAMM